MLSDLEISVILTTYQRPEHLERSLISLSLQQNMKGKFEVVVADDGSKDRTRSVVEAFARMADFPVKWITHAHRGFRVALCRNDGARASTAPYLLFSDGDCIFPVDHLQKHLQARRPGIIRAGDCLRLDREATERIDAAAILSGAYRGWVSRDERHRLFQKRIKERCYQLVRHPSKPKLTGFNIGISREDFEAVNGFDESFVGWGCEDDDLAYRLRLSGRRIASALSFTHGYHMWHPTEPSRPEKWTDGPNVDRLHHLDRPIRCVAGYMPLDDSADFETLPAQRTSNCAARLSKRAA
ncbi:MAG: glycosyltransferase [Planctomycetes bacterium]|nr:glycosyltransferase [Planctomycetota bacterium]